jgi:L-threonylcarbamoyladenylate synthase
MLTKDLNKIIHELANDNIVSIPTDTVYGLSCKISKAPIDKVIDLKKRDSSKGFIIISHDYNHLLEYADISKLSSQQIQQICSIQDKPTTWIVPGKKEIQWLTGGKPTIAIRLVNTDIVKNICSKLNSAIISTSANISGEEFINNAKNINDKFPNIYALEANIKDSTPSNIIDIITAQKIR